MADESEQLAQQMEQLRRSMQDLNTATDAADKGLVDFAKSSKANLANFTKTVGQGNTEFKNLNSIVDITSNALAGMAKAIPFAGEAVAAGLKAAAEGAKFMLDQMDQTTKAFNDISKVGALTAAGMSGLQKQFLASGLSLQSYTKVIGENSQALARFRGMTGDGADEFVKITGALTQGDLSLRRLGLSADQIGDSAGEFVKQQTRLGRSQNMSTNELIAGTKSYVVELDALQKVTGLSREAIQKQQDAALSESRFRANYEELMSQGREKEAKALMTLQTQIQAIGPELGQGVRDLASGAANTEAARKLLTTTGGAAQDIISRLKEGQIDQYQAAKELQDASRRTGDAARTNAKYVDKASSSFVDFAQQADLNNAIITANGDIVKKTQDKQLKGTDKLTNETVSAQANMEQLNREINQLGFTFLPQAAIAVESVTNAMKKLVQYVNSVVGGTGASTGAPNQALPGSTMTGMDMGGAEIMGAAEAGGAARASLEGLPIKRGATAGGSHEESLAVLAQRIYKELGGELVQFTGLNDGYARDKNSKHPSGKALDFTIKDPSQSARIAALVRAMPGVSYVQDEYLNPSPRSNGNHIHAEISAKSGAVLSGPTGGYKPNLTMHGTEAIVPLNSPAAASAIGPDPSIMMAQLAKLDELVSVMKNQLAVSSKLLSYSS